MHTLKLIVVVFSLLVGLPGAHAQEVDYTRTRYPIVLAHGMAGFDTLFGAVDYWYGVPEALRAGGAEVFLTRVSAFNRTEERAEQLLRQIEIITALTGKPRVNIIAHSQGGLDSRYVMGVRPDLVASLTTVATPHKGTDAADFLRDNLNEGGFTERAIGFLADQLGEILALLSGSEIPQDAIAATESLTSEGAAAFNARFPWGLPENRCGEGPAEVEGIKLFSMSGASALTNPLDATDAAFAITTLLVDGDDDGLVPVCSSHFGVVIRDDFRQNHGDEVGQLVGLVGRSADARAILRAHAHRLREAGL
ncbi:MAG: lipase family alpha/beta hydrolase [Bradymonadia bacterium]